MSVSKKLSLTQLVLMGINTILIIVFLGTSFNIRSTVFFGAFTSWFLWSFVAGIATLVIGILQIIYGGRARDDVGVAVAAGILGILVVIPYIGGFIAIAGIILNIIVLTTKIS